MLDTKASLIALLLLTVARTPGRMMGVVTDATTRLPLQYAWVKATDAFGEGMAGVTDENGSYTFDDLLTGDLTVRVERKNYRGTETKISITGISCRGVISSFVRWHRSEARLPIRSRASRY